MTDHAKAFLQVLRFDLEDLGRHLARANALAPYDSSLEAELIHAGTRLRIILAHSKPLDADAPLDPAPVPSDCVADCEGGEAGDAVMVSLGLLQSILGATMGSADDKDRIAALGRIQDYAEEALGRKSTK